MKRNLWIMYAIALLQGMVFYGPIATLYRQAHGLTIFQITLIESISLALLILLEIPWGIIADKIGCRHTIIFCSALYLISKIIFWKADGFAGFLVERIMLSVVESGFSVCGGYPGPQIQQYFVPTSPDRNPKPADTNRQPRHCS